MTTLREAAQQALDALGFIEPYLATERQARDEAVASICAALAAAEFDATHETLEREAGIHISQQATGKDSLQVEQAEQEPVAWANMKGDGNPALLSISQHPEDRANWTNPVPLYTHPPRRKWQPLTDEQINDILQRAGIPELPADWESYDIEIARAIEQAHGIVPAPTTGEGQ